MQSVGRRYVQYINQTYRRTGTLWEGRFKSSAVQEERYFLLCSRYIELNPVRAGMVVDPGQYRWSSYRHNGLGQADERLTPHAEYLALGQTDHDRQTTYRMPRPMRWKRWSIRMGGPKTRATCGRICCWKLYGQKRGLVP